MKQLLLLIIIFFSFSLYSNCFAVSQYANTLTKIEKSLFGTDYNSQSDEQRLSRIEETVYGSPSSQPIQSRITKISQDLSADQLGQEIKPKADTFANESDSIKEDVPKSDKTVNYPVVDNLENSVFNKTFKSNDINQRLANLEQQVFHKTYNDDLNSRVERLKNSVSPQKIAQNDDSSSEDEDDNDSYNYNPRAYNKNFSGFNSPASQAQGDNTQSDDDNSNLASGQPSGYGASVPSLNDSSDEGNDNLNYSNQGFDETAQIARLEKKILRRTYPNDNVSNRLLRLELKEFNSAFTDDDTQTRVARIASAYQAKKSASKYDSNKFAQHMATAVQVGAILLMILAAVL